MVFTDGQCHNLSILLQMDISVARVFHLTNSGVVCVFIHTSSVVSLRYALRNGIAGVVLLDTAK
jgi:hypothetical protein